MCNCGFEQDGVVIADPSAHRWIEPVTSVSSDRLITSHCVDELHHDIICHSTGVNHCIHTHTQTETHQLMHEYIQNDVFFSLQLTHKTTYRGVCVSVCVSSSLSVIQFVYMVREWLVISNLNTSVAGMTEG